MGKEERLLGKPYKWNAGPRTLEQLQNPEEENEDINCQAAAQLFFYEIGGIYLPPELVFSQEGYRNAGKIVAERDPNKLSNGFFNNLKLGDLIFAERAKLYRQPTPVSQRGDEWERKLHVAVFVGRPNDIVVEAELPSLLKNFMPHQKLLYHATNLNGRQSEVVTAENFVQVYHVVRARRIT